MRCREQQGAANVELQEGHSAEQHSAAKVHPTRVALQCLNSVLFAFFGYGMQPPHEVQKQA